MKTVAESMSRSLPSCFRHRSTQASGPTINSISGTGLSQTIVDSGTNARETTSPRTWFSTKTSTNGQRAPGSSMIFGPLIERQLTENTLSNRRKTMAAPSPGSSRETSKHNFRTDCHSGNTLFLTFIKLHKFTKS